MLRKLIVVLSLATLVIPPAPTRAADLDLQKLGTRVVFLGDSITHAGGYVALVEARLRANGVPRSEFINLGLPSEGCTGLSEPMHPFPRPNVHERLDRVLSKLKPDGVIVCYGMNDGIYYPFSDERFEAYKSGINKLIKKVKASGSKIVLCTPPAFDPLPMKKRGKLLPLGAKEYAWTKIYEDYDKVMERYAKWILEQKDRVDGVVDLHTPVNKALQARRKKDPNYSMSNDGVHVNMDGHKVLADAILAAMSKGRPMKPASKELVELVTKRQNILHPAWLSFVGHKRPGVKAGPPINEALTATSKIDQQIDSLLGKQEGGKKKSEK